MVDAVIASGNGPAGAVAGRTGVAGPHGRGSVVRARQASHGRGSVVRARQASHGRGSVVRARQARTGAAAPYSRRGQLLREA
ncbi:hypothetical protein [Kribbella sp. ALI-6-A]|uniref:hypothetical protein n=1 Tax=Kribbella sp. ALI-6-A TaxID=1933817 RepID=UPI00117B73E7|nr:hypothetical protein [Kribbella sp. ALI-6-A]